MSTYDGPIIDAFVHGPWIGEMRSGEARADRVDWKGDRRLQRVMKTFSQEGEGTRLQVDELLGAMDRAGVERAVLAVKVYYPAPAEAVEALNRRFAELCARAPARLRWIASLGVRLPRSPSDRSSRSSVLSSASRA